MRSGTLAWSVSFWRKLQKLDNRGASAVEFAILAPVFLMMMFGILQVGIWLQNYNAVRSIASDGARYVMIEYQKDNELTDEQIRLVILGQATSAPYLLDTDRIGITVVREESTRIAGAEKIAIDINYSLSDFIPGVEIPFTLVEYSRSVWVATE